MLRAGTGRGRKEGWQLVAKVKGAQMNTVKELEVIHNTARKERECTQQIVCKGRGA